MREKKLGVAIHGAGTVAGAHAASWKKNPHIDIVSVSSRRPETARAFADKMELGCRIPATFDEVLADPNVDIVNISGPNQVHADQGIAAARAGKHILIEKPMVLTRDENRALRDAVNESGVKSVVSFVLRWNPLFEMLKSLLAKRMIGDLFYVEVDYWHGISDTYTGWEWAHTKKTGGSAMLLGGCHAMDAIRWFVRDEVVEVTAMGNNQQGAFEYDANVVAILKFRDGAIGKTSVLLDAEMPYSFNIDLVGTSGTLRDNRLWAPETLSGQTDWARLPTIMPDSGDVDHHPFDAQIDHFVDCIREDRESHCNVADAYHTHEVCIAIDRSLESGGKPIRLETD